MRLKITSLCCRILQNVKNFRSKQYWGLQSFTHRKCITYDTSQWNIFTLRPKSVSKIKDEFHVSEKKVDNMSLFRHENSPKIFIFTNTKTDSSKSVEWEDCNCKICSNTEPTRFFKPLTVCEYRFFAAKKVEFSVLARIKPKIKVLCFLKKKRVKIELNSLILGVFYMARAKKSSKRSVFKEVVC